MALKVKSKNWTNRQILTLVRAVNEHKLILFGKFEPGRTNVLKDKAWIEIA